MNILDNNFKVMKTNKIYKDVYDKVASKYL